MAESELNPAFMARALHLARKGWYTTAPNPQVGCVLVKNGHIIGEGWHRQAGGPHAEIEALSKTTDTRGATAYVTLEPCSHYGKTPPCSDALIAAGIDHAVVAMQDPNPLVSGRGLAKLQAAGIAVTLGMLEADARALNRGFIKRMTEHRPFVRSKIAMSLDGRTAMASGASQWITSPESRTDVHRLRAESSAIVTGVGTVLADDPALTARVGFPCLQPLRVVLDSQLQTPPTAKLAKQTGQTLILTISEDDSKSQRLEQAGFTVHRVASQNGRLDLPSVMAFLSEQQINNVLVEAGSILNGALLKQGLIDELIVYMAPCVLGDQAKGLFHLPHLMAIEEKFLLKLTDFRPVGTDLRLQLTPKNLSV